MGLTVEQQMAAGQFAAAQKTWTDQLDLIDSQSNGVVRTCLTIKPYRQFASEFLPTSHFQYGMHGTNLVFDHT